MLILLLLFSGPAGHCGAVFIEGLSTQLSLVGQQKCSADGNELIDCCCACVLVGLAAATADVVVAMCVQMRQAVLLELYIESCFTVCVQCELLVQTRKTQSRVRCLLWCSR